MIISLQVLLFVFLIGFHPVFSASSADKNKLISFDKDDITICFMQESLLVNCRLDTLIGFFELECEVDVEYEGPKREIKTALKSRTVTESLINLVPALFNAYERHQNKSIKFMLSCLTDRFADLVQFITTSDVKYPAEFIEFIQSVERSFHLDKNYFFVNYADYSDKTRPHIPIEELMLFEAGERLPSAIRYILDASIPSEEIDSVFIKNRVLSRFDLHTAFILYEVEMMDLQHSHDLDGVIEKHLKGAMFFEKNTAMAFMAQEMYNQQCWAALKLIIDTKFSYDSLIRRPIWFQDLYCLREYAMQNCFPEAFFNKVRELASPAALRRLQKCINAFKEESGSYFIDEVLEEVRFSPENESK